MITNMSDLDARDMLLSSRLGRLGCIVDGEPYIVPVNFIFEENCVYVHSLPGHKITGMRENPRACLQVDEIESDLRWRSVLAFGNFEEIVIPDEREVILSKLFKLFPMLTPVESALAKDGSPPEIIVFRIRVNRITGVSEG